MPSSVDSNNGENRGTKGHQSLFFVANGNFGRYFIDYINILTYRDP